MHGIRLRSLVPVLPALLLLAALLPMLGSDPATGVTISRSPFTDEGYNLLNARNVALLGQWSTGDWNLHLVNGPFSPAMAGIFTVFGVGLEPARLLSIALSAAAVTAVGISVAAAFGSVAGTVAGFALAGQALYLYYGRLALLEPMVTFFLVAGAVVLVRQTDTRAGHGGLAGGLLLALAVATKPSAAFAALGICVGLLLLGAVQRDAWWRGLAAVGGLGLGAVGWLVVVALPNLSAVATDLRIWPAETPPSGVGEAWERVSSYVTASDGALPTTLPLAVVALLGQPARAPVEVAGHHGRRDLASAVAGAAADRGAQRRLVRARHVRPAAGPLPAEPLPRAIAAAAGDARRRCRVLGPGTGAGLAGGAMDSRRGPGPGSRGTGCGSVRRLGWRCARWPGRWAADDRIEAGAGRLDQR